jgi:hypothetical protein
MSATDKKATKDTAPEKKRQRGFINGQRLILEVRGKEPGFHYSWIGEEDVYAAQTGGFEHVRHPVQVGHERIDVSKMPTDSFVTRNVGGMKIAYLMRIPQEDYDSEMNDIQNKVNEQERARVRDNLSDGLSGSIKVKTS